MSKTIIRTRIYLTDLDYFCNKSWTISYNMNTRSWISFHSYLPNWYIAENNFFYSGLNGCCDDFDVLLGTIVPEPTTSTTTSSTTCGINVTILDYTTTTSTTTVAEPTTTSSSTTMSPVAICLDGLIIETIYLHIPEDLLLLPEGYTHPCQDQINLHFCNRALFEVFGNGVYIADSRMNNEGGSGGVVTSHGTNICEDYHNVPDTLVGGIWTGNTQARYNRTVITQEQAIAIAAAGGETNSINFSLVAAMTTYNATCDADINPHSNITWVRISELNGTVIYNGCPEGNFATVDVCPTTSTTTTILH